MLCSICGTNSDLAVCAKCSNSGQRRYYYTNRRERLAQGLCARCGLGPPLENSNHCQNCKDYAWDFALNRIGEGLCYRCGKNPKRNDYSAQCEECAIKDKAQNKAMKDAWRAAGKCSGCGTPLEDDSFKTCLKCREKCRSQLKRLRDTVIHHYGAKCKCCGETTYEFLTIDHVNGGGSKHREAVGGTSKALLRSIIRNRFPETFQILCFNCNCGKQVNKGVCPHQSSSSAQPSSSLPILDLTSEKS